MPAFVEAPLVEGPFPRIRPAPYPWVGDGVVIFLELRSIRGGQAPTRSDMSSELARRVLTTADKISIAVRSVWLFVVVRARLRGHDLPRVVSSLSTVERARAPRARPVRVGRIVARTLSVGPWRARCLHTSLVLYRLLREQGERPELVIGLKESPSEKDAHAWIEVDGRDVGPPPGRGRHQELARYAP